MEHLLAACLHLTRGEVRDAADEAALLEHPQPLSYVPFLAQSLRVRLEAARGLRNESMRAQLRQRLEDLGRSDLLAREPCSSLDGRRP